MQTFLASEKIALCDLTDPVWQENGGREMKERQMEENIKRDVLIDNMFLVNYL